MTVLRMFCSETGGQLVKGDVFQRVVSSFPEGIQMAFAYGSGVFQQTGNQMSKNMLDFIFVVESPEQWHEENLISNSKHYSSLSKFGPKRVAKIQEKFGAGVYFNTLVPFEQRLIKYGVIGKEMLIHDLIDWETLYISGRLHKPVKLIVEPTCPNLMGAMRMNLENAVHAALLLLPEKFSEEDLFLKIASLSYSGDFRMTFGEDKGKVGKIVAPNVPYFLQMYETILEKEVHLSWDRDRRRFEQHPNHITQFHHLNLLPKVVLEGLIPLRQQPSTNPDLEEVIRNISLEGDCPEYVAKSIAAIVKKSSWRQSLTGLLTAGVSKSARYSFSKVVKMVKGMMFKKVTR